MRGHYGYGYVGWPWAVVGQQARVPTMPELIAQLQALDVQIQQTNREIATLSRHAVHADFVSQYWRPFVTFWDRGMKEVYEYQAGTRRPGSTPLVEALTALTRMRRQYHELLWYAVMGVNLDVSMPPEFMEDPYLHSVSQLMPPRGNR
jgi:hypothetical protein